MNSTVGSDINAFLQRQQVGLSVLEVGHRTRNLHGTHVGTVGELMGCGTPGRVDPTIPEAAQALLHL